MVWAVAFSSFVYYAPQLGLQTGVQSVIAISFFACIGVIVYSLAWTLSAPRPVIRSTQLGPLAVTSVTFCGTLVTSAATAALCPAPLDALLTVIALALAQRPIRRAEAVVVEVGGFVLAAAALWRAQTHSASSIAAAVALGFRLLHAVALSHRTAPPPPVAAGVGACCLAAVSLPVVLLAPPPALPPVLLTGVSLAVSIACVHHLVSSVSTVVIGLGESVVMSTAFTVARLLQGGGVDPVPTFIAIVSVGQLATYHVVRRRPVTPHLARVLALGATLVVCGGLVASAGSGAISSAVLAPATALAPTQPTHPVATMPPTAPTTAVPPTPASLYMTGDGEYNATNPRYVDIGPLTETWALTRPETPDMVAVWLRPDEYPAALLRTLDTALRHHPDTRIVVFASFPGDADPFAPLADHGRLLTIKFNARAHFVPTPLDSWARGIQFVKYAAGRAFIPLLERAALLSAVYRYGAIGVTPGVVFHRPVDPTALYHTEGGAGGLPDEAVVMPTYPLVAGAMRVLAGRTDMRDNGCGELLGDVLSQPWTPDPDPTRVKPCGAGAEAVYSVDDPLYLSQCRACFTDVQLKEWEAGLNITRRAFATLDYTLPNNVGDHVQSLAGLQHLPRVDATVFREFPQWTPPSVLPPGATTLTVMGNGWYAHRPFHFPPPDWMEWVPVSMFIASYMRSHGGLKTWLKAMEPIGCRDLTTVDMVRGMGVEAYLSGCLTLTLQDYWRAPRTLPLVMIDIPADTAARLPPDVREAATVRTAVISGDKVTRYRTRPPHPHPHVARIDQLQANLHDMAHAQRVYTVRIHGVLPAMALGTAAYLAVEQSPSGRHLSHDARMTGLGEAIEPGHALQPGTAPGWDDLPPDPARVTDAAREMLCVQYDRLRQDPVIREAIRMYRSFRWLECTKEVWESREVIDYYTAPHE